MDMEQEEMQFLGLFGIYKEAYKLMFRWGKIFTQITLTLILPLSLIFLAYEEVSTILFWRIRYNEFRLHRTTAGTPAYHRLADLVSSEWVTYILLKAIYLVFLLAFSLLSTAAVVYTIASVYAAREVTFRRVMSVVPRVWKRLMVTFLCIFLALVVYNTAFVLVFYVWHLTMAELEDHDTAATVVLLVLIGVYAAGFVYMTIIWQLASVVSVLEDSCGFRAMAKSRNLIRGKMVVTAVIFFKLNLSLAIINFVFRVSVVYGYWRREMQVGLGVVCLLLLFKLFLLGLVVQTVIYFVCKSYHHESIDKSALSDHLEVLYLGEHYVPLKPRDLQDVQMGEYRPESDRSVLV
ncbi:uncharacterized protein LOC127252760 isoform X2 [Andrographis paniculata]|nr:uncharacterized protein LOC127252760 isoform X2 [Andrographis paniculata]XP_051133020.1 uncharacterized protein LOC127252760 isoform X2 [Andrographis paniculata]XP_051133021.1 uncharacterized protein LOC127252760 isoform X2 [Andrographis paniculata]